MLSKLMQPSEGWRLGQLSRRRPATVTLASKLQFERVTRIFGNTRAVDNFSLEIAPGEIVCLLGPSGCGKTTALRLAAGIDCPDAGRIMLDAVELAGPNTFVPPEKRGIGLMFQDFALFPHLTVLENVAFGVRDLGRAGARAEAMAAIDRVGLAHYAREYPHILSGGEQQRVALARAMAPRPNVLLMDEPFSGLDEQLRGATRDRTRAILREMRATCLMVTHASEEAMQMGDRIAIMRCGRVVQCGTAETLYRSPTDLGVARTFSELNEFPARVKAGAAITPLGRFATEGFEDGASVLVCVRQRSIRITPPGDEKTPVQVRDIQFLGDDALLELRAESHDMPIWARIPAADSPPVQTTIGVTISEGGTLVFAADDVTDDVGFV